MKIATAPSITSKCWTNDDITVERLWTLLSSTTHTPESVLQYQVMTKSKKQAAKDRGGFVGGELAGGVRNAKSVNCRSIVVLDMDFPPKDAPESIFAGLPYLCMWHTTHSHTPEKPRYRLVIPLARDVSRYEYPPLAQKIAQDIGIELFDKSTFEANRLMLWPTTPCDGEFLCGRTEMPLIDPDAVLARYTDWRDASTWPMSPVADQGISMEKAGDPRTKRGPVGLFCRTYTMEEALEKFLSEVYAPTDTEGRYAYLKGSGTAGLLIYDDTFAYSHHGTDPCCTGHVLNAFDIVRIHLFGERDAESPEGTAVNRLPSYIGMKELVAQDPSCRRMSIAEKRGEVLEDFHPGNWMESLTIDEDTGKPEDTIENLELILANDPDLGGFALNEMAGRVQVNGPVPWSRPEYNLFWRDADTSQLKGFLDKHYTVFSARNHDCAFSNVTQNRRFHPVRDYLNGLPEWDGVKRVEDLFIRYLGADDSDYVRQVTIKTFAAAVKRIYEPGCKFDSIIVLDGSQGIGKSTIVRDLVTPEFYSDSLTLTDMEDKSGAEKLQGLWVAEIGELAGMKKADVERVKAFVSAQDDKYRPSYGRVVESHPRSCIIIATVNGERGYLRDLTGNRRFWCVKLNKTEQVKNWNFDKAYRDQFWAEAKAIWLSGENLFLEGTALAGAEKAQREAMEEDERIGLVEKYLETLLPENWSSMDASSRRSFLEDPDSPMQPKGVSRRETVSGMEIWVECFGGKQSDFRGQAARDIAVIMRRIEGWEYAGGLKISTPYGRQKFYKCTLPEDSPF